jgi:D-glycero-D-manno-heptose 1,7-bisphosphate phosphatase
MNLSDLHVNKDWTLFLDRDGVINERLHNDYVKHPSEFHFLPRVLEAISALSKIFGKILIVTNQQGIGKGLMTENDLKDIHALMLEEIDNSGGKVDWIFYCPYLKEEDPDCRKPKIGMAMKALEHFPDISFSKCIMVGDTPSDIGFARNAGMISVWCGNAEEIDKLEELNLKPDFAFRDLYSFSETIKKFTHV